MEAIIIPLAYRNMLKKTSLYGSEFHFENQIYFNGRTLYEI